MGRHSLRRDEYFAVNARMRPVSNKKSSSDTALCITDSCDSNNMLDSSATVSAMKPHIAHVLDALCCHDPNANKCWVLDGSSHYFYWHVDLQGLVSQRTVTAGPRLSATAHVRQIQQAARAGAELSLIGPRHGVGQPLTYMEPFEAPPLLSDY